MAADWSTEFLQQAKGFVLYSAPKKEITALALDRDGNIYAAGVGEKRGGIRSTFSRRDFHADLMMASNPAPSPDLRGGPVPS